MDPARVKAWQRFFDTVVANGAGWPRGLWFPAVEDGLAAALGREAPLVEAYRRDVAELQALERNPRDSWHDEQRRAQLEAQIHGTLRLADQSIRGPSAAGARDLPETDEAGGRFERAEPFWPRALRVCSFGIFLLGSGLLGGIYLYDARLARQVNDEVGRHVAQLQDSITRAETNLTAGMASFGQESERVGRLQAEFAADSTEFAAEMRDMLEAMTRLRETAMAELEERLAAETSSVAAMMARLQDRGAALNRGLDQVSADLAALEQRLPEFGQNVASLEAGIEERRAELAEAAAQVAELQSAVPEVLKIVETERAEVEEAFAEQRRRAAGLGEQITALEGGIEASDERMIALDQTVEERLRDAKEDGLVLERTTADLRASADAVASLVQNAEAELELARATTQNQIETMLTEVAEKADLAVMRGDDVIGRAQAEAARRVETASGEAIQTLDRLRQEEIAALAEAITATRAELEQTRAGLVASWQRMDRFVTERHNQLLSQLDRYAQTMEARVQQLLEALNVMVAQTEQKKS